MSKKSWFEAHISDTYVKQANSQGYRSRAAYKLAQINQSDRLFHSNMTVIDLGAAPGSWSQWLKQNFSNIRIFAVDILPIEPLTNVTFLQGDFQNEDIVKNLIEYLGNNKVNLLMSDMSPNISGIKTVDQARIISLAESVKEFTHNVLAPQGHLLIKLFQGEECNNYIRELKTYFKQVIVRKPNASRKQSSEIYVVAKYYNSKKC